MLNTKVKPVPEDFVGTLDAVLAQGERIRRFVERAGRGTGLRDVYLVGSGASYYATWPARYLLDGSARRLSTWHTTAGEFVTNPPGRLGAGSLVVAASHTGHTAETTEAAELARRAGATVAAVTRNSASPLAEAADEVFDYPSDSAIVESRMLLFQQFAHALLAGDPVSPADLRTLPELLRRVKERSGDIGATLLAQAGAESPIYVVGAGPSFGVANALACCYLQEMQWLPAAALPAADFFHGPVEAVTSGTPVVVLLGEDRSRPVAARALRFLRRYSRNVLALDSRELMPPGPAAGDRAELSAFVLASAARRAIDHVAAARGHDLATRRYMRRVEY